VDETPRRELVLPKEFYVVLGVAAGAYLLYALSSVLTPLLLAFSIAYVLNPLISRLQAWKVPRPAGIALVLLSALGPWSRWLRSLCPALPATSPAWPSSCLAN